MKRLQAYKFQIEPNGEQLREMRQFAGNARKVWNLALDRQQKNHAAGEKFTNVFGMNYWLPAWKEEFPFLQNSPTQTLQQVMADLGRGYKNLFEKRAAPPVFKKKGRSSDSFRFPDGKQFTVDQPNRRIKLPKLGWIRYRNNRKILGTAKNITVSSNGGKWFISIQTEREVEPPIPASTRSIGIDVGIARFATLSDGSFVAPLNSFKQHQERLARYQRRMSRKVKYSRNWKKANAKVQKIHTRIAHARKDFLHKTTTTISQKSSLNRAILDQGWGEFRRQLAYKLEWNGGTLLAVPPHNTRRTCPACGHIAKENRRTQAQFRCVDCGYKHHADVVGAINVLARGHRVLACEAPVQPSRSVKQEPAEVIQ